MDMLNHRAGDLPIVVHGLNVIVQQYIAVSRHLGIIEVGYGRGQHREVYLRIIEVVAPGECAAGHGYIYPTPHTRAAGIGLVGVVIQGIPAVAVLAHLQGHTPQAGDVMDKGPDPEVRRAIDLLVAVKGAEVLAARVVGIALGEPDGGTDGIIRRLVHRLGPGHSLVAGHRGLELHVQGLAVVHVAAVQRTEEEVPGPLQVARAGLGIVNTAQVRRPGHGLGGEDMVGGRSDHRPVALVLGPAGGQIHLSRLVDQGPVPVQEEGSAEVAVGIDPGAALHMDQIIRRGRMIAEILLNCGGRIAGPGRGIDEVGRALQVIAVATAKGIVPVMGQEQQHGLLGIIVGLEVVEVTHAEAGVAILPRFGLGGGHYNDSGLRTSCRIDIAGAVGLVGKGYGIGRRDAPIDLHSVIIALGGILPVCLVGGGDVVSARALDPGIILAGPGNVGVGDHHPLKARFHKHGNEVLRKGHLRGEEALGDRPGTPDTLIDVLIEGYLHPRHLEVHQRQQGVMEGKDHHIQAGMTAAGLPGAGLLEAVGPASRIAELILGCQ